MGGTKADGPNRVIFDSSFLMAVVDRPTTWYEDIAEEIGRFDSVVLDCVRLELRRLAAGQGRKARTARVALELSEAFEKHPCGRGKVDDEVISAARSMGAAVATVDSTMRALLKSGRIRTISLRSGRVFFG